MVLRGHFRLKLFSCTLASTTAQFLWLAYQWEEWMQMTRLQSAFSAGTLASHSAPPAVTPTQRLEFMAAGRTQVLDDRHMLWNEKKMMALFNWLSTRKSDRSRKQKEQYVTVGVICPVELRRQHNTSNGTVKCVDKPTNPSPGTAQRQEGQGLSVMDRDHFTYKSFSLCELSRKCHPFAFNYT